MNSLVKLAADCFGRTGYNMVYMTTAWLLIGMPVVLACGACDPQSQYAFTTLADYVWTACALWTIVSSPVKVLLDL